MCDIDGRMRLTGAIIVILSLISENPNNENWITYFQEGVSAHLTAVNPKLNLIGQICAEKLSNVIFDKKMDFELKPEAMEPDLKHIYDTER